jgi:phosphoribosylformylglycinamidine synthase subunit PurL
LSEMTMSSNYGIRIQKPKKLTNNIEYFFGEDQGRYILEIDVDKLSITEKILKDNNIFFEKIGYTQKNYFEIDGELKVNIKDLFKINNEWYNKY